MKEIVVSLIIFVGGVTGLIWLGVQDAKNERAMRTIPYEMTPTSVVRCYNRFGTLVFEDKIVEKGVEHVVMRLPCSPFMSGGCCISDAPVGGEDTRKWGIGRSDSDVVISVDGRGIECVSIK